MDGNIEPRTHYEAVLDIEYHIRLQQLQERLRQNLRKIVTACTLLGGASAFAFLFDKGNPLAFISTGLVTVVGFADVICDFTTKAIAAGRQRQRYQALLSRVGELTVQQIDSELATIAQDSPPDIESLCRPAQKDVLRSRGHDHDFIELDRWHKFVRAIA